MNIGSKLKLGLLAIPILLVILFFAWQLLTTATLYVSTIGQKVTKPTAFEFTELDTLLKQYAGNGLVNYAELKHSDLLTKAMTKLEGISPENFPDKKDVLAFWINAYNLATIKMIADHYPISNIPQLGNAPSSHKFIIGGKPYSPQDMFIRCVGPLAYDQVPKSVFLACGGSLGYPRIPDHAVRGKLLDGDSEAATEVFIADSNNIAFVEEENHIYLSPFFSWNANTLTKNYPSLDAFVASYLPPDKGKLMNSPGVYKAYNKPFDWRINDSGPQK
jgi:Protein of unknown function, DUF547